MEETRITTKEIQKTQELIDFIKKSPSCYHVIHNIAAELEEAGYEQLNEAKEWTLHKGGRYFVTRNQSSLIAFTLPEDTMGGFLICASHSDSPTFKLKSNYEMTVDDRYLKLNVEKYGGMICSTWLDRPLSVAGRVVVNRGDGIESVLVNLDRDLCLIPNLAIHMNRQINEGYAYNAQKDMLPLLGEGTAKGKLKELLAEAAEYEKAISTAAKWEESLEKKILRDTDAEEEEKDRDRIRQSHMIRMQCYRAYGYVQPEKFAEAIAEAEKAETGTPKDIGMLIEKAQIYVEMEEYERCAEISQKLIGDYQVYAAYANELEAAKRQWNAAGVIQNGRACLNYFPTYVKAYEMMAKVYMDLTHPEELKELLQQAKDNNVKSVILDAYEWQLTNTGLPQEQMNDAIDKFRNI